MKKHSKPIKKTKQAMKRIHLILALSCFCLVMVAVFSTIKAYFAQNSYADTTLTNMIEPENGTFSGTVSVIASSSATGGKYIRLGGGASRVYSSWLWTSPDKMQVADVQSLLSFAKSENISTIYLDIDPYVAIAAITDATTRQQRTAAFSASVYNFISTARSNNIAVEGLAGDTDWANPVHSYIPPQLVDYVLSYNQQYPDAQFDGLHLDIEFYGLADFSTRQVEYSQNYLAMVKNLVTKVNNTPTSNIKLGFAVPFWFDEDGTIPAFAYNGKTQRLSYHVLDVLNSMTNRGGQMVIMAYRNYADGTDGTIAITRNELNYSEASAKNTNVIVGQEVSQDTPAKITFYGLGKPAFYAQAAKIDAAYARYSTYKGIGIHHLVTFQAL